MNLPPAQHILICFHDFPIGGTERIAIGLATYWVAAGRQVTILCGTEAGPQRAAVDPRVRVVQLDPPITRSALSRFRLGREMGKMLAALAPDIIFLPGNFHLFLANNLRKAAPHIPIALKISNPPIPKGWGETIARAIFKHFVRGVDGLAPMNEGLAYELRATLPKASITTLHDPIYFTNVSPNPQRKTDVAQVLWAGRLEPQKDVALALKTIAALNRRARVHLTMLGGGAEHGRTIARITEMDLAEVVTLAGHVPSIDPYLATADVLLITSHFEGGPAVAAEALAHGVPIVATDCSHFLRELMSIPEAGKIVASRDPEDLAVALDEVCQNPPPTPNTLSALIAHLEPEARAQAYLAWLDGTAAAARVRNWPVRAS